MIFRLSTKWARLCCAGLVSVIALTVPAVLPAAAVEKAVAPEKNSPGDIPDSQVFVDFASSLGFAMQVPEGWSRKDAPSGAIFADKYNTITIAISAANVKPSPSADDPQVAAQVGAGHAVKVTSVKDVQLKAGPAVRIVYSANSDPNPVTNKQIRLEGNRYLFFKDGKLATLDLTAPLGADNVDQWQLMANSFRWR